MIAWRRVMRNRNRGVLSIIRFCSQQMHQRENAMFYDISLRAIHLAARKAYGIAKIQEKI